jgi:nucleoside-diphosphate-sugar epimerase
MTPEAASERERRETVLVTGGSGFLGGWCLVELLRRGYRARTTVRSLSREPEVRAAVGSQVEIGDRLSVLAADLLSDAGWEEAVGGCDYVLHVASPFPPAQPKDPDELIVPARDGTLRVLRASLAAGVKRVVVTSSVAAVRNGGVADPGRPFTEEDWADAADKRLTPYTRSKTIAEQAAWDLVREADQVDRLAVVNPGAIIGPVLSDDHSYSLQAVERMFDGMPGLPRLGFSFVDVRDVAERHARKVPRRSVPDLLVRAMALVDPGVRSVVSDLGHEVAYSSQKAYDSLGWSPRPIEETIVDCARSLLRQRDAGSGVAARHDFEAA